MGHNIDRLMQQYNIMSGSGYARGGAVRYDKGGPVEAEESLEDYYQRYTPLQQEWRRAYQALPANQPEIQPAVPGAAPGAAPAAVTPAEIAPKTSERSIEDLLLKYTGAPNDYSRELALARRRSQSETEAFSDMIKKMSQRAESPISKAEMYFRLASAFGSPTKTGKFTENLSMVGKEMGEYTKGRRAEEAERRGLGLKAQEIRMAGAREDLATTRALAAQEASERRALSRDILKEYLISGRPQSEAGKLAIDAGYKQGSPQYGEFVDRYLRTKLESGELYKQAMLAIQEGNLELRRSAEARKTEAEKQLSPTELKMKVDSENSLSASKSALRDVSEALRLNENSFGMGGTDWAQYQALSRAGSNAPRVQNTRIIENLLSRSAIDSLKEKFGAGITNEERRALVELEGALAKTPQERAIILRRSLRELERSVEREERRLKDISSGVYRQQTPSGGSQ